MKESDSHIGDNEFMVVVISKKSKMRVQIKNRGRPKDELDSLSGDEFLTMVTRMRRWHCGAIVH
jgi:hypothetical protein